MALKLKHCSFITDKVLANFLFDPYARPNTKLTGIRMEMGRGKKKQVTKFTSAKFQQKSSPSYIIFQIEKQMAKL